MAIRERMLRRAQDKVQQEGKGGSDKAWSDDDAGEMDSQQ